MGKVSKETNVCDFSIEIFLCSSIFGPSFHKPSINHCQCVKMTIPQPGLQHSTQFGSVTQSRPTLCDPMDCSTPGLPVHHQLLEFTQTHVHWVGDAIQPSHPRSSPSPLAFDLSQHHGLFKWVSSLHQVAKVWEFQLNISPSNEYSGLISIRMDQLDLLTVQGTLKSLLQHHSSKASILRHSAFFIVQLSHLYVYITQYITWLYMTSSQTYLFTVSVASPSICHEVMGPDAMILVFWMLHFKPTFSLSSITFIKRLFSSFFTFCHKSGVICISEVIDISPGSLNSSLCFFQPSISHDVLCIEVK